MSLDYQTLMIGGFALGLVTSLVLLMLWIDFKNRYKGILSWMIGNLLVSTGMLMIGLRESAPQFLTVFLSNLMVAAGAFTFLLGIRRFFDLKFQIIYDLMILGLYTALHSFFIIGYPSVTARIILISLLVSYMSLKVIYVLFRDVKKAYMNIKIYIVPTFVLYFGISFFRLIATILEPVPDSEAFMDSSLHIHAISVFVVMALFLTMSVVMMVNRRLNAAYMFESLHANKTFDASPFAMLVTRLEDGLVIKTNEAFTRIFGYTDQEAVGKTTNQLNLWERTDSRDQMLDVFEQKGRLQNIEISFKNKAGQAIIGLYSAVEFDLDGRRYLLNTVNDISEFYQIKQELAFMATHDQLTSLPNRHFLYQRFNDLTMIDPSVSVIMVDLDCFKVVNDAYGHDFGDEVLVKVSKNLTDALLDDDFVSRFGGDEFVIIVPGLDSEEALGVRREHYRKALSIPFVVGGLEVTMKGSFGIAFNDFKSSSVSRLVKIADKGVYLEKEHATDCTRTFRSAKVDK